MYRGVILEKNAFRAITWGVSCVTLCAEQCKRSFLENEALHLSPTIAHSTAVYRFIYLISLKYRTHIFVFVFHSFSKNVLVVFNLTSTELLQLYRKIEREIPGVPGRNTMVPPCTRTWLQRRGGVTRDSQIHPVHPVAKAWRMKCVHIIGTSITNTVDGVDRAVASLRDQ